MGRWSKGDWCHCRGVESFGWQWGWLWELWRQPGAVCLWASLTFIPSQAFPLPAVLCSSTSVRCHICLLYLSWHMLLLSSDLIPVCLSKWLPKKVYKMQNDLTRCEILHRVVKICPLCAVRMNDSNFTCREKTVCIFRAKSPLRSPPPFWCIRIIQGGC